MLMGVGKIKKTQKSTIAGHKTEEKVQMQASNRGTKGLGKLFGAGCSWWKKGMVGKLATHSHAPARDNSRRWKNTHVPARGTLFDVRVSFDV